MQDVTQSVDCNDIIRILYLAILDREPDNIGLDFFSHKLSSDEMTLREIGQTLLHSDEFKASVGKHGNETEQIQFTDFRVYPGYSQEDLAIFSRFDTTGVGPAPGFLTDWIGSRTRISSLWQACEPYENTVMALPVPGDYHADAIEWVGTLKAVLAARGSFSVMELGAGYGPWLAASCAAAQLAGISELHLCGVEADPGRFRLLSQNIDDNDLSRHDIALHQAAIGVKPGRARWPRIVDPANDSGVRPLRPGNLEDRSYLANRLDDTIEVKIIAMGPLLRTRPVWDLIHIDVQGTEVELCRGCLGDLTARARYLVVGLHSRKLDGDLIELLLDAGWVLEHEKPTRMVYHPGIPMMWMSKNDGTQVWRNPKIP